MVIVMKVNSTMTKYIRQRKLNNILELKHRIKAENWEEVYSTLSAQNKYSVFLETFDHWFQGDVFHD